MAETRVELPQSGKIERAILDAWRAEISAARMLWGLATHLLEDQDVVGKGKPTIHNICLAGNYAKQMRLFLASYRLSLQGLDLESFVIIRSMYIHVLHLQALEHSKDSVGFARDWVMWDLASDEKAVRNLTPFSEDWKKVVDDLYSPGALTEDKARYGGLWSTFLLKGPTLMPLDQLARLLKAEEAYRHFFPLTSGVVHGSDLLNYSRPRVNGEGIELLIVPPSEWVGPNLASSISFLRDSCALINTALGLNKTDLIEEMTRVVRSLSKKGTGTDAAMERLNIDWIERARGGKDFKGPGAVA